ncbi:MAG: nicotinate-nucleotide adenylyltransferase [Dehalococcoidales bacterium]|jgi:nicotinate-nucleotide adenylyltransferase
MSSIGVLGGTFNPVHNGHLAIAGEVTRRLGIDEVWFMPAGHPWMKADEMVAAASHRVRMLRLAIQGHPSFRVSTIEVERPGDTYTVETFEKLREIRGEGDELYFIMSWGTLAQLPRWREPERLIKLCRLIVVPRMGTPKPDLESLDAVIPGLAQCIILLDKPLVDISATDIRRRVARGEVISQLVPPQVAQYIKENGLYRG